MATSGTENDRSTTIGGESEGGHTTKWESPDRTIAFSDAVFAIIITLLVLDLIRPEVEPGHLFAGLMAQWPAYVAYLATYLLVGIGWMNHKAVFHHVRRMDWGLNWGNMAVLFSTGLLPFPTAVMARAVGAGNLADERTAVGLYAAISVLATLTWLLLFHYLRSHPELLWHEDDPTYFARERRRAVLGAVLYAGGGLLGSLVSPALALAIFVLMPVFYAVTSEGLPGRGRRRKVL
jgi:uncharacterized membrane protein